MNLLSSDDLSKDQILEIFEIADSIREGKEEITLKEHSVLALLFEKPSTRTRVSFEVAIAQLGGHAIYIDAQSTHLKRGESFSDTARMLSSYCDFIAARLYSHSDIIGLASNSTVPVINALTDLEHPTQALTDIYTIRSAKKNLKNLKLVFVGDIAANTANSLMLTAAKLGIEVALLGPKGYMPQSFYFTKSREYGKVDTYSEPEEALEDADIIYTDTFVSMGQEQEAESRKALFAKYQVNSKMLEYAKKDALVMHCLPAHRGEEITSEVLDGPRSIVWEQAKNKMLLAKAILLYLSKEK
ncbi:MAG: ornithine carbamoyltransferase [Candidatus Micrarchaeaceae archaeon]